MRYLSCIHFYGFSSVFRLYETLTNFGVYFSTSRSSRQFGLNGPIEALRCMSIAAWKGYDHEEHRQATRRGLLALKLHQDITVMSVKLCVTINFLWRHFTYSLHLFQRIFTLLLKNQACPASTRNNSERVIIVDPDTCIYPTGTFVHRFISPLQKLLTKSC